MMGNICFECFRNYISEFKRIGEIKLKIVIFNCTLINGVNNCMLHLLVHYLLKKYEKNGDIILFIVWWDISKVSFLN